MPALGIPGLSLGLGWDARKEQPTACNVFLRQPRARAPNLHRDPATGKVAHVEYVFSPGDPVAVTVGDTHSKYGLEVDQGFAKHRDNLNLSASLAMKVQ